MQYTSRQVTTSMSSHTRLAICSPAECSSVVEELLRRLTLQRNVTLCSHLTFLVIEHCIPTALHSALLNMVESRIKSHTGQVPEEPALCFLQLHLKSLRKNMAELDKVGKRHTAVQETNVIASQSGFKDKASGNCLISMNRFDHGGLLGYITNLHAILVYVLCVTFRKITFSSIVRRLGMFIRSELFFE